jgi:Family of unknown function (DUF5362)
MENELNLIETDLIVDSTISAHLKETAVWGKFLGVIGFIYSGLVVVGAIFAASMFAKLTGNATGGSNGLMAGGMVGIVYLGLAGVVFFMSMYLFRFAKNTQVALKTNDQETLAASFKNLKVYFRFAGIITVVALIITVLGIMGLMLATAFSRG